MNNTLSLLRIDASGRKTGSTTRNLLDDVVTELAERYERVHLVHRDLADSVPHVDGNWIAANFTAAEDRSYSQRKTLEFSDRLVAELQAADTVVIGVPIYNFGVPAALKAWIDMIARAKLTFRYTEDGPKGLLNGKRAILVVASGGVGVDSEFDFATPYMRRALNFVGINDITVISADSQNVRGEQALTDARNQIAESIRNSSAGMHDRQVA